MPYRSDIPSLDHTFNAEDILRSASRSAMRLAMAFSETGNYAAADKIEGIAAAIDGALDQLREAAKARNSEMCREMGDSIASTFNAIMRRADNEKGTP